MTLNYKAWLALRPKRSAIEAALQAVGVPLTGWMNEMPTFALNYVPDWDKIENIATTIHQKGTAAWLGQYKEPIKAALKKGGKRGKR
jgi:hypothetical protein